MAKTWEQIIWREFRAYRLTPAFRDVALCLHNCAAPRFPSHEFLAERARRSVRTVQRAMVRLRDLGLLDWSERRVKRGWRWLRTSNVYRLLAPATTGQDARGVVRVKIQRLLKPVDNRRRLNPAPPIRTVAEQLAALGWG